MISPPYSNLKADLVFRSQWWLLRMINVHHDLSLDPPDLSKSATAWGRAQTTPQELWVFLSCFNPRADVARAQQLRAGHIPAFFCSQNHSSPNTRQFITFRLVMWDQSCRTECSSSLSSFLLAKICWWVNSVLRSFTSDTVYLHPS